MLQVIFSAHAEKRLKQNGQKGICKRKLIKDIQKLPGSYKNFSFLTSQGLVFIEDKFVGKNKVRFVITLVGFKRMRRR